MHCCCRCSNILSAAAESTRFRSKEDEEEKEDDHHLLLLRMFRVYWGQFGRSYNRTIPQGACPRDGKKKRKKIYS
jgi:hypothetical protein